jgi:hypothetical protein
MTSVDALISGFNEVMLRKTRSNTQKMKIAPTTSKEWKPE